MVCRLRIKCYFFGNFVRALKSVLPLLINENVNPRQRITRRKFGNPIIQYNNITRHALILEIYRKKILRDLYLYAALNLKSFLFQEEQVVKIIFFFILAHRIKER